MKARLVSPLVLVCAGIIACDVRERVVEPDPYTPPPSGEALFGSVLLSSRIDALVEGDTVRMKAVPADLDGNEILVPYAVTYGSYDPSIATVSQTGLVTALALGSTEIWASIVVGHTTKTTAFRAYVFSASSPSSVVLISGRNGWQPSQVQVTPGGTVEWRIEPVDWAGVPVDHIALMDGQYRVVDSIDVKTGSGTRRFESRAFYRYCTGMCWDPPDWGVIYVR